MTVNVDPQELSKFAQLAEEWWNPNGSMKPLHQMNPVRGAYICQYRPGPVSSSTPELPTRGHSNARASHTAQTAQRARTHSAHPHWNTETLSSVYSSMPATETTRATQDDTDTHTTHPTAQRLLDVGCGGGLLSEWLAQVQATHAPTAAVSPHTTSPLQAPQIHTQHPQSLFQVTGIDASAELIAVAQQHAAQNNLPIHYHATTIEAWGQDASQHYDIVCCMELLEHVPDPASFIQHCARLTKPGGHVFFSTINRTLAAFLGAIVAAEYLMGMLPRGTHTYDRFIRPSELDAWAQEAGLRLIHMQGLAYHPWDHTVTLTQRVNINYMCCYEKPAIPAGNDASAGTTGDNGPARTAGDDASVGTTGSAKTTDE